jgi:hypothetical protein
VTASPPIRFISTFPYLRAQEDASGGNHTSCLRICFAALEILQRVRTARSADRARGWADTNPPAEADNRSLVLFDRGDELMVQAGDDGIRFLLVSGKPLEEPVAWYGPIVMNTQEQLRQAFSELDKGTFLKPPRAVGK